MHNAINGGKEPLKARDYLSAGLAAGGWPIILTIFRCTGRTFVDVNEASMAREIAFAIQNTAANS
ncbi:hypothetical protein ZHAS_00014114 [Anopheles sinensis]|uniref:Uncharacterized protein n=1 Tax=Anopheles sinensis TaxID=74873 RepID=A0A084W7N3_ANOSI|nr:hypothetical protein ZHAS_00014114 [Anopheles sinensis]